MLNYYYLLQELWIKKLKGVKSQKYKISEEGNFEGSNILVENLDQAQVRSDPNKKNKGAEVAKACLDILLDEQ